MFEHSHILFSKLNHHHKIYFMLIQLEIRKSDLESTSYYNAHDCAITRAFARLGYTHIRDHGTDFFNSITGEHFTSRGYRDLADLVQRAYCEPHNFTFRIEVPDNFLRTSKTESNGTTSQAVRVLQQEHQEA